MPPFDANPLFLQLLMQLAPETFLQAQLAGTDALAPTRRAQRRQRDKFGTKRESISPRPGTASHTPQDSILGSPGVKIPEGRSEAVRIDSGASQGVSSARQTRPGTAGKPREAGEAVVTQRPSGFSTEISKRLMKTQFFGNDQMHPETAIHHRRAK